MYKLGKKNQTVTWRGTLNVYDCVSEGTYNSSHAPEASEIQLDWTSVIFKLSTAQGNRVKQKDIQKPIITIVPFVCLSLPIEVCKFI